MFLYLMSEWFFMYSYHLKYFWNDVRVLDFIVRVVAFTLLKDIVDVNDILLYT